MYKLVGSISNSDWWSRASKKNCGRKKIFFCQNEKISRREDFVLLQIVVLGQRRSKHDEYCSKAHFWMDRVMRITIFRAHRPELFSEWWSRKWHWQHPIHPETMFLNSILYSSMPSTSWCPTVKKSKHSIERLFRSRRKIFFPHRFSSIESTRIGNRPNKFIHRKKYMEWAF